MQSTSSMDSIYNTVPDLNQHISYPGYTEKVLHTIPCDKKNKTFTVKRMV